MTGRVGLSQLFDHLREGEPLGDIETLVQAPAELGAGDVQHLFILADLVGGHVLRAVFEVDHFLERHHRDIEFSLVLGHQFLCVIGSVERLAL